jgi:hypothetical protein
MNQAKCKNCKNNFPLKRYEMGYRICTECSAEPKWSAVPIINHKTGNEVQIVKDPEDAAEFLAKSARIGFGTMRGMSSSYKRKPTVKTSIKLILETAPTDKVIARKPLPNQYEEVGDLVMSKVETGDWEGAEALIQSALNEKKIWGVHAKTLNEIVNTLKQNEKI